MSCNLSVFLNIIFLKISFEELSSQGHGVGRGNLDAILAEHKDQQERVAEEMIALTRSLKEQSAAAGSLIRKDTAKLGQVNTENTFCEFFSN